jgi:hypothetical protein
MVVVRWVLVLAGLGEAIEQSAFSEIARTVAGGSYTRSDASCPEVRH